VEVGMFGGTNPEDDILGSSIGIRNKYCEMLIFLGYNVAVKN
jgi:hypothetical protein